MQDLAIIGSFVLGVCLGAFVSWWLTSSHYEKEIWRILVEWTKSDNAMKPLIEDLAKALKGMKQTNVIDINKSQG